MNPSLSSTSPGLALAAHALWTCCLLGTAAGQTTSFTGVSDGFGEAVEITGDLNGLGQREILIGNPGSGSTLAGQVTVVSPETGATLAVINDPNSYVAGQFGRALADVGDVDGDPGAISDFAVGNPGANFGQGRVIIYRGNAPTGTPIRTLANPPGTVLSFGYSLANVGDLDGDSVSELAVGAPGFSGQSNAVHIYDGASGFYKYSIQEATRDSFGQTLAHLGNGRLAIGAPFATVSGQTQAGWVSLYQLGNTGASLVWQVSRGFSSTRFGSDLAPAGDIDGDGTLDVAITAPGAGFPGSITPSVMVFSGNPALILNPLTFFNLAQTTVAPFTMRVANIGDTDGDGSQDIAITNYDDIFVLAMDQPTLTLLTTIPGSSAGILGGWRGELAGEKDLFGNGTINLVAGAPRHVAGAARGLVRIQPVAATSSLGQGCAVTAPAPELVGTARALIGGTFQCDMTNQYTLPGSYLAALLIDFAPPVSIPFAGCTAFVTPGQAQTVSLQPLTPGVSNSFAIQIPSTLGSFQSFILQGAVFDPLGNIDLTNGLAFCTGTF